MPSTPASRHRAKKPAAPANDEIIFKAWATVIANIDLINDRATSQAKGDRLFAALERARELIAVTPAVTVAGLAVKVRCILEDMLEDQADIALPRDGAPQPDKIDGFPEKCLCHLLVQLEAAARQQVSAGATQPKEA